MESENEGEREKFIKETKDFIEKECAEIGELLATLSWTPDHILKGGSLVQCPHDAGHFMPESSLKQHSRACRLKKMGLSAEEADIELRKDNVFYEKANLVGEVQLDEGLLNRILWNHSMENRQVHMGHRPMPLSGQDYEVKLSNQERLGVYDYCVKTLKERGRMANVEQDEVLTTDWEKIVKKGMLEQGGERPKTKFELLSMLRDQKRRRQTYRAKNVHVTKKSYTEIIREVIHNQMEIMIPSAAEIKTEREVDKDKDTMTHKDRGSSNRGRYSQRSRSRERSRSGSRSRNQSPSYRRQRRDDENSSYSKRRYDDSKERRRSRSRSRSRSRRSTERDRHAKKRQRREVEEPTSRVELKSREKESSKTREDRGSSQKPEEIISRKSPGRESGKKKEAENGSSHSEPEGEEEMEEGQIECDNDDDDDSSHQGRRKSSSKKKSSKHKKKSKHKKHRKSKARHSDSD